MLQGNYKMLPEITFDFKYKTAFSLFKLKSFRRLIFIVCATLKKIKNPLGN